VIVTNQNKHNVSRNCRNVFLGASETHEDTFTLAPTSHRAGSMSTLNHPRASWPERAPRPRRIVRDYTDVLVMAVMVGILVCYGVCEHRSFGKRSESAFRGGQTTPPHFPRRVLAFAVTNSVGWNTPESEGEVVTTKGLTGFETSYAVWFGDAREQRNKEKEAAAGLTSDATETGLLADDVDAAADESNDDRPGLGDDRLRSAQVVRGAQTQAAGPCWTNWYVCFDE
jgi:hypothetical protein